MKEGTEETNRDDCVRCPRGGVRSQSGKEPREKNKNGREVSRYNRISCPPRREENEKKSVRKSVTPKGKL